MDKATKRKHKKRLCRLGRYVLSFLLDIDNNQHEVSVEYEY